MALLLLGASAQGRVGSLPGGREEVEQVQLIGNADRTMDEVRWSDAACASGDARLLHLFFSEESVEIAEAKAICGTCPLRLPCLEGAIERAEPWGVWGGQLFERVRVIAEKRGRGRPRREEVLRRMELELELERELGIEVA
jgi:hypothetical protein